MGVFAEVIRYTVPAEFSKGLVDSDIPTFLVMQSNPGRRIHKKGIHVHCEQRAAILQLTHPFFQFRIARLSCHKAPQRIHGGTHDDIYDRNCKKLSMKIYMLSRCDMLRDARKIQGVNAIPPFDPDHACVIPPGANTYLLLYIFSVVCPYNQNIS